jgi:hypothetical protein
MLEDDSSSTKQSSSTVTPVRIEAKVDPLLKSLHKDPRFATFLKKLNTGLKRSLTFQTEP